MALGDSWHFGCTRELFESAAEASRDAERIRRQLEAMEAAATATGGSGSGARVSSTPDPQRMAARVDALVDREAALERRREEDYQLVDLANRVLYGTDSEAGLWALVGWRADAIAQHYLNGLPWAKVGELMGYTAHHCWRQAQAAFEVADGWGLPSVMAGMGAAEA